MGGEVGEFCKCLIRKQFVLLRYVKNVNPVALKNLSCSEHHYSFKATEALRRQIVPGMQPQVISR